MSCTKNSDLKGLIDPSGDSVNLMSLWYKGYVPNTKWSVGNLVGGFGMDWQRIFIIDVSNNAKYGPAVHFFAIRPSFRSEFESDNEG